jgi:hypothetical protein
MNYVRNGGLFHDFILNASRHLKKLLRSFKEYIKGGVISMRFQAKIIPFTTKY